MIGVKIAENLYPLLCWITEAGDTKVAVKEGKDKVTASQPVYPL
jgi:hypothetical protein